jgi:hypothetical protein
MSRAGGRVGRCLIILAGAAGWPSASSLAAQHGSTDLLDLRVVPFFALPLTSDVSGSQQAVGAHVVWPAGTRQALAGRYEVRWTSDGRRYDVGSLDVAWRLVGNDTTMIAATGGWARWGRRDHATAGLRAVWPFVQLDEGGTLVLQGWFDARYAVPGARALAGGGGMIWTQLMLGVALRPEWRRG